MVSVNSSFRALLISVILFGLICAAAPAKDKKVDLKKAGSEKTGSKTKVAGRTCKRKNKLVDRAPDAKEDYDYSGLHHPDPREKITLYHGTSFDRVETIEADPGSKIEQGDSGEFSPTGGLYLTDSFRGAAQWGCHGRAEGNEDVFVIEYVWDGTNAEVLPFRKDTWKSDDEYDNFCYNNFRDDLKCTEGMTEAEQETEKARLKKISLEYDMIEGPMMPVTDITPGFWQYAVLKTTALKNLKYVKTHAGLSCKNFPKGEVDLKDLHGPSAEFPDAEKKKLGLS